MNIESNLNVDSTFTIRGTSATITSAGIATFQSVSASSISAVSLYDTNLTGSKVVISNSDKSLGESVTTTAELGYVSGVTSSIQSQLIGKQATLTTTSNIVVNSVSATSISGTTIYENGSTLVSKYSLIGHPHTASNITDFNSATKTYSDTLYLPISGIDASKIITGTIDPARIPVLPSQVPQVTTNIPSLSVAQQNTITSGTIVTTSDDGFRYVYSGTGSKTTSASYIALADITPEWSVVSNRPTTISYWYNDSGYLTTSTGDARYSLTAHNHNGLYLTSTSALNPANVTQTSAYRFVTDTEKTTWNNKQTSSSVLTSVAALSTGTGLLKLTNGVASLDTNTYATTTQLGNYLAKSGGTMSGNLLGSTSYNIGASDDWWGNGYFNNLYAQNNLVWHAGNFTPGNYLPLSGGTMSGNLLGSTSYNIGASGNWWGSGFFTTLNVQNYPVWHSGNFTPGNYLAKSGGTMSGALNFANNTWNTVGDDVQIGDINLENTLGLRGTGNNAIGYIKYGTGPSVGWTGASFNIPSILSASQNSLFLVRDYLGNAANEWVWFGYNGIHTNSNRYAGFMASKDGDVIASARYNQFGYLNAENSSNTTDNVASWNISKLLVYKDFQVNGVSTFAGNITTSGTVNAANVTLSGQLTANRIGAMVDFGWIDGKTKDVTNIATRLDSGWYQNVAPTTANGWPVNGGWWHLISSTHTNTTNYFALQLAADFFTQDFRIRSTNGNGATAWSTIWTDLNLNQNCSTNQSPTFAGLIVNGTTSISSTSNVLRITMSNATNPWASSSLCPSLGINSKVIHLIGQSNTNNNSGYFGFYNNGSGSGRNMVTLGLYGNDDLFTIYGNAGAVIKSYGNDEYMGLRILTPLRTAYTYAGWGAKVAIPLVTYDNTFNNNSLDSNTLVGNYYKTNGSMQSSENIYTGIEKYDGNVNFSIFRGDDSTIPVVRVDTTNRTLSVPVGYIKGDFLLNYTVSTSTTNKLCYGFNLLFHNGAACRFPAPKAGAIMCIKGRTSNDPVSTNIISSYNVWGTNGERIMTPNTEFNYTGVGIFVGDGTDWHQVG